MVGQEQTIAIRVVGGTALVRAAVYGDWAAHPAHHEPGWCITHVPSGRRLRRTLDESQARAGAALLLARLSMLRWREGEMPHPDDVATVHSIYAEIRALPPPVAIAHGHEGSCEACTLRVDVGERVHVYADDVVVHERCPGSRERAQA